MNILVDTSVWSLALRRRTKATHPVVAELGELVQENRAHLMGPIRQELLSGIKDPETFDLLRSRLDAFPDIPLHRDDYATGARYFNLCQAAGIQGSNTDYLICAVAVRAGLAVLTTDGDFAHFAKHVPVRLHKPRFA